VNRAMDGDVVAIELVSTECDDEDIVIEKSDSNPSATIPDENTSATPEALEGLPHVSSEGKVSAKPSEVGSLHGRVVGVIKRSWRQYAGSIDPSSVKHSSLLSEQTETAPGSVVTWAQLVPVDPKIPRIWISTRRIDELVGFRLLATIGELNHDNQSDQCSH